MRDLAQADGHLPQIAPGVTFDGDDLGRWLTQQTRDWHKLTAGQRERLSGLGVQPAPRPATDALPHERSCGAEGAGRLPARHRRPGPVPRPRRLRKPGATQSR
ncbi:helicase associated domain-containing protein [Streptomyces sp. NBC_00212]|uniref:helicase associated domain-containing protein n=1 Tax=Streptomyces sp. NBC_00212 TaxID=2975684 RepID=UPI003244D19C